jgi:outer membrane protein assembly factor BamB
MEDAVSLYLQLGKEYGPVVVRDGKTGADFMTTLLTDKRLLPYLEPSRYPMPTRMKAEERQEQSQQYYYGQHELEPQGDLFPMYRRLRFVLDQNSYTGQPQWSLRVFDRATGAEKMRPFTGLNPIIGLNLNTTTLSKFAHANGQGLLLQLGYWVYCFDLAEKKLLWQKNLVGENFAPNLNGRGSIHDVGADGEVIGKYDDGYIITLGKALVLQAGYAAVLTRDGLEVVEPLTRRVLWTRRDIRERTQIFGDARYIVLVEMDAQSPSRPVAARVLRAVDGLPVEGSGDSGRVLAAARSYQVLGRNVLLSEGTGEQPRVLRLLDLGTGKDVWRKEYDPKAVPIKSHNPDWAGYVRPNGEAEILDVKTGKPVATLKVDEKNLDADLKPAGQAQLFLDSDRYYLFLDRDASAGSSNGTSRLKLGNNMIRTVAVNGALYAFDRGNGKRLWYYGNGLFENQLLVIDQFAEMPVILAAGPMTQAQGNTRTNVHPVVVIEKARGRLLLDKQVRFDHQNFLSLKVDHKNGTIDLTKPMCRIAITPDDASTVAGP